MKGGRLIAPFYLPAGRISYDVEALWTLSVGLALAAVALVAALSDDGRRRFSARPFGELARPRP